MPIFVAARSRPVLRRTRERATTSLQICSMHCGMSPLHDPPSISLMWNELCDDAHEAHALKVIHRACMVIALTFVTFAGVAIGTRLGADTPPASVAYGSEQATPDAAVFGN